MHPCLFHFRQTDPQYVTVVAVADVAMCISAYINSHNQDAKNHSHRDAPTADEQHPPASDSLTSGGHKTDGDRTEPQTQDLDSQRQNEKGSLGGASEPQGAEGGAAHLPKTSPADEDTVETTGYRQGNQPGATDTGVQGPLTSDKRQQGESAEVGSKPETQVTSGHPAPISNSSFTEKGTTLTDTHDRDQEQSGAMGVGVKRQDEPRKTVHIPDQVRDLLHYNENTLQNIKAKLFDEKCLASFDHISEGYFSVDNDTDKQRVIDIIGQFIVQDSIKVEPDDEDCKQNLKTLLKQFPEKLTICENRSGVWSVVYTSDIKDVIQGKLQKLKTSEHSITLPLYAVDFIALKLNAIKQKLKEKVHPTVDLQLSVEDTPRVVLSADRGVLKNAIECFERFVLSLQTASKEVEVSQALYLQAVETQEWEPDVEEDSNCRVDVILKQKLAVWTSPQGLQLQVREGHMATTDCSVMVLPLAEGQTEWPSVHRLVLRKGEHWSL